MPLIKSTVACNLDHDILAACLPLFGESKVEAIEWSFDALFNVKHIPDWFLELLHTYSSAGRLIGHGIFFSLFSGRWLPQQEEWLKQLRKACNEFHFDHITEHFGYMTGRDFHSGAPLNIPYSASTLRIGQDRLKRIYDACHCPVGLENLAFSSSADEVKAHGAFLEKLIAPVNGFIILDLHNLYCQLSNFALPFDEVIGLYPLDKVREIHISGGSWQAVEADPGRMIRRDTHDDGVPADVFVLLEETIPLCPHLQYVVMEQLGTGLKSDESRSLFYNDFKKMSAIVQKQHTARTEEIIQTFLPATPVVPGLIINDETLYLQQRELANILETATGYTEAIALLQKSSLAHSEWQIENWDPAMIETAMHIAQKWK